MSLDAEVGTKGEPGNRGFSVSAVTQFPTSDGLSVT